MSLVASKFQLTNEKHIKINISDLKFAKDQVVSLANNNFKYN
jgi:hypothetical protein